MSVQDPASSLGAPGGAWEAVSWATARSGGDTGATNSKTRNVIDVKAPLRRFIHARTRSSPLPRSPLQRCRRRQTRVFCTSRSEEHTSELQSLTNLVCRLLLEKKKNKQSKPTNSPKKKKTKNK